MMQRQRFYHRFIRPQDLPELEAASASLFAFDVHELSLKDIISSDRWFCLAAVASCGSGDARIVGFVAAALGSVREFPQEAQYLEAVLAQPLPGEEQQDAAAASSSGPCPSSNSSTSQPAAASTSSSSSSSSGVSDALALEVVLLGVQPGFRRRGVGSRLLKQVQAHARTRGASLLFLHVQDSNTPARSLYQKAGFNSAAVLRGYYSQQLSGRRRFGPQQQEQEQDAATQLPPEPAAAVAADAPGAQPEFSSTDAELLVLRMDVAAADLARNQSSAGYSSEVSPAAVIDGGTTRGSSSSRAEGVLEAPSSNWQSASSQKQQQQQQQQPVMWDALEAPPSSSSSSSKLPTPAEAAEVATQVVTSAAAAAVQMLLAPAVGLLGGVLARRLGGSGSGLLAGARGELVQLGDEWMVQVRKGGNVVMYDPDEVPAEVVLSDRDQALLQRQRQRQQELLLVAQQQQQQQQQQHSDSGDDNDDTCDNSSSGSMAGSASLIEQQPAGVAAPFKNSAWQGDVQQQLQQQWQSQQHHQFYQQQQQQPWLRHAFSRASCTSGASCENLQQSSQIPRLEISQPPLMLGASKVTAGQQRICSNGSMLEVTSSRLVSGSRSWGCRRALPPPSGHFRFGSRKAAVTGARLCGRGTPCF